jgi:hypothetical protein
MSLTIKTKWFDCSKLPNPSQDTTVFCDVTDLPTEQRSIYLQVEPEAILGLRRHLLLNGHRYNHIITFDHVILRMFPHAKKYIFGGCWIRPEEYLSVDPAQKQFQISSIVGSKQMTEGHRFRTKLYTQQQHLPSVTFYRSSREGTPIPEIQRNPILAGDSKFELFKTYQFSLVIENSRQENYFTEKLIDCLITKTIPIYWGCPNIDDYFDTTGWIVLETTNVFELAELIKQIDTGWYERHSAVIEDNYQRSLAYKDTDASIARVFHTLEI